MKIRDRDALRFISSVTGKDKLYILILLVAQGILGLSSVIYALLFRNVIDGAVQHEKVLLIRALCMMIILIILQISLRALVRFFQEYAKAAFENTFKRELFSQLMRKDFGSVTAIHSGEWMNRLTSDTAIVAEGLVALCPGIVEMLAKLSGASMMIIVMEPYFAWFLFPGGTLLLVLTYTFRMRLKEMHKQVQEADGRVRMFLQEHLESLVVVKSFSAERTGILGAGERMKAHRLERIRRNHFSNRCSVGFAIGMNITYMLGIIYSAVRLYHNSISYGNVMALIQLIAQLQTPFVNITGYVPKFFAMLASAERLMEAEKFSYDLPCENGKEKICEQILSRFAGFEIRNAVFSYNKSCRVANGISLTVSRGEFIAFTGDSGSGKSTLLKLLMSLYPLEQGEKYILLKNSGILRREVLDSSYRSLFAYVPQGNYLMSGTIKEVVALVMDNNRTPASSLEADRGEKHFFSHTDREITDSVEREVHAVDSYALQRAFEISCAAEFIGELEHGADTVLGERGAGLSEGQMQRLAIARAVYSSRPVLLLDEATSALDINTEKKILSNLKTMTDKTVILVTHRESAVRICDRRIHFSHGMCREVFE